MRKNTKDSTAARTAPTGRRQSRQDSIIQVTRIGRLVAAPELRETSSGKHVTNVRLATNGKSHTEFHNVVLWGQLADFATSYLGKGRLVDVEWRLESRQWQATDGTTRTHRRDRRQAATSALQERASRSGGFTPRGTNAGRALASSLGLARFRAAHPQWSQRGS